MANGTQIINWDSFIGVSVTTGTLLASEFTMIYFAYKCFQATRIFIIRSCCSPKSRRLHWQFFYALVAQTIIPILFMQIPMTLIYTSTIVFRSSIPEIGHFQSLTIPIYLAIDALPTILIVRPYRDTLKMKMILIILVFSMLAAECLAVPDHADRPELCSKCNCRGNGGSSHDHGHLSSLKDHGDHENTNPCIQCCRSEDTSDHGDGPHGHDDKR
ncbi:hypothetical protein B9Z55_027757 [Caenorhabditis nigoni]|nr:hypothetical protein B9Z55_027757 [Caenorhabditis nigoni]